MAETIRIEVTEVGGGGGSTSGGSSPGFGTYGGGGTSDPTSSNFSSMLNVLQRIEASLAKGGSNNRTGKNASPDDGGNSWASYLNQQLPFGSFAINQMYAKQEGNTDWVDSLMGLPDRMERALIKAQHQSWGKDPQAFERLQEIAADYRVEKFKGMVEQSGDAISKFAQSATSAYKGMASNTIQAGRAIQSAGRGFASAITPISRSAGVLVSGFAKAAGVAVEVIGFAQAKLKEEAGRVRGFSPELRMQSVVSSIRELMTDVMIAEKFGKQMAQQEDQDSRREAAWRLIMTKISAEIAQPISRMSEAYTGALEFLSGQRTFTDAMVNLVAAIPMIGEKFQKFADWRNEQEKERRGEADMATGKKLCEAILEGFHPGEFGIGVQRGRPEKQPKKNQEAVFTAE